MRIKSTITNALGISFLIFNSCSSNDGKNADSERVKVDVHIADEHKADNSDAVTSISQNDPLFLGFNVIGDKVDFTPTQLSPGDHILDLPVNKELTLKARALAYKIDENNRFKYYITETTKTMTVLPDTREVELNFPAFKEALVINVFGSAVNKGTAAANWSIAVKDPFTDVAVVLPGATNLTTTNANGSFAFKYLFASQSTSSDELHLEFTSPTNEKITKNISLPSVKHPGFSTGYLNLSSAEPIMLGKNADDFDGDGYSNLVEDAMGTNPFAVNSGACVDPSQVQSGFTYYCPDGEKRQGSLNLTPGMSCWEALGDVNKDNVIDKNDCAGPQGSKGEKGDRGDKGDKGDKGDPGNPGQNGASTGIFDENNTYLGEYFSAIQEGSSTPFLMTYTANSTNFFKLNPGQTIGSFYLDFKSTFYSSANCTGTVYKKNDDKSALYVGTSNYYKYSGAVTEQKTITSFSNGKQCLSVGKSIADVKVDGNNILIKTSDSSYYVSRDGGTNWVNLGSYSHFNLMTIKNAKIYLAANSSGSNGSGPCPTGTYRCIAIGTYNSSTSQWEWYNHSDVSSMDFKALTSIVNSTSNTVYAVTEQGIFKSNDGAAFSPTNTNPLAIIPSTINFVAFYAYGNKLYYIFSRYDFNNSRNDVYLKTSTDGGDNWTAESFIFSTSTSNIYGSSMSVSGVTMYLLFGSGAYFTPSDTNLWISKDNGVSWSSKTTSNGGLPSSANCGYGVYHTKVNGNNSEIILSTNSCIYISNNYGDTWTVINNNQLTVGDLNTVFKLNDTLYMGSSGGLFKKRATGDFFFDSIGPTGSITGDYSSLTQIDSSIFPVGFPIPSNVTKALTFKTR